MWEWGRRGEEHVESSGLGVVGGEITERVAFSVDVQSLVVVQFAPGNPAVVLSATALEVYEVPMSSSNFLVIDDGPWI